MSKPVSAAEADRPGACSRYMTEHQGVSTCQSVALHAGVSNALLTMSLNANLSVLSKRPLGHVRCARQERAPRRYKLSYEA